MKSLPTLIFAALFLASSIHSSEGSDIEIGGAGSEPGKFMELRDIAFDVQNNLYTLDGLRFDGQTKENVGNCRVQKFDSKGKLLAQFSVRDEKAGDKSDPQRITVDTSGKIWVTHPK